MADRPLLVSLIGGLTLLSAVIMLIIAAVSFYDSSIIIDLLGDIDIQSDISLSDLFGFGGLILGVIVLIIGLAIWRGWSIAWYIAVILYIISAIGSVISIFTAVTGDAAAMVLVGMVISLLITIVILYYLFTPKVKEFFLG